MAGAVDSAPVPLSSWTLLAVGVAAASTSAVLVRYASGVEPLAVSFWRCAAGAAALAPFAHHRLSRMDRRSSRLPALAGVFLAVHFAAWITSLGLTTVAAAVLLVSTTPVFVALASWALWGERLSGRGWAGIAAATVGTALVGGGGLDRASLTGGALALVGGAAIAGYAIAGRRARARLGNLEYAVVAYAVAAVLLLAASLAAGSALWGYPAATWAAIAGIVVGPQLLGHTIINFVLRDIDAVTVTVVIMAEPVIATALAFLLLGEVPPALVYPGGIVLLGGIYAVATAGGSRRPA